LWAPLGTVQLTDRVLSEVSLIGVSYVSMAQVTDRPAVLI